MKKTNQTNLFLFFLIIFSCLSLLPVHAEVEKDIPELEALLQSIIEEKTTKPDIYVMINLGNFFLDNQLYEPSLQQYDKVLEIDPFNKIALLNKGSVFVQMEQYHQAMDFLLQNPFDDPYYHYLKGLIYRKLNQLDKAIEEYEKVIEFIPNHPQLNAELGQLHLDNHQLVEANKRFVEMNYSQYKSPLLENLLAYQENAYCYLNLGHYYRDNGYFEKAQEAYHQATLFENDQRSIALAYFYQGEIYLKDHHYDQAILEKELAQRMYPLGAHHFTFDHFSEAFLEIGDHYYFKGKLSEALEHYELAADLGESKEMLAQAHYKQGLTYYRNQDYSQSLRQGEIALHLNPDYLSDQERLIDLLIANSWSELTKKE